MKPKVGFICVHNSCRSQMAEALGKWLASETFESFSAGTESVPKINEDAVRTIYDLYQFDMSQQRSKTLEAMREVDIVITMGCNVQCPQVKCSHREDWGLDDPTGKSQTEFKRTAKTIEKKVLDLKRRIETGKIDYENPKVRN
ncbi:arsenate reductase ArsC [Listeria aquatica]|uniref:Arsenate reductase ArsC n=1 Tax=Listeria aquatica TaxID=1494960 RepID=A0A841ZT68_9LIST|nr:arsenate reductase ArsC [Listeria aquatica]MBC1522448.1 arsenate reductase ArsC [Listeria aquatica]